MALNEKSMDHEKTPRDHREVRIIQSETNASQLHPKLSAVKEDSLGSIPVMGIQEPPPVIGPGVKLQTP